jgi:hypothetical protein
MLHSRVLWKVHSKDHPVAVTVYDSDTLNGSRTPPCRTQLIGEALDRR